MTTLLRRVMTSTLLGLIAIGLAGCGKKLVGNTYKSGNGQISISFTSDTKADVKRNGQEVDDVEWSRTGDVVTAKTRVFGDMKFNVQSDGTLKFGEISLPMKAE